MIPRWLSALAALAALVAFAAFGSLVSPSAAAAPVTGHPITGSVDLHAHLFFSEGLGIGLWNHGFSTEVLSPSWNWTYQARVNAEALEQSGAAIVVVALYAHPLAPASWSGGNRAAIRRQLAAVDTFLTTHSGWGLARSSREARTLLESGRKALVLQIEGAGGILETPEDVREFVDTRGVRLVTLHHFTDDALGGAAFMRGFRAVVNPLAWIRSGFGRINSNGLAPDGQRVARELLRRGVWLDLSHASDAAQRDLIQLLPRDPNGGVPPILYTHTILRQFYDCERGITGEQLELVKKSGGMVGILPSSDMLAGTPGTPAGCGSGAAALLTQTQIFLKDLAPDQISLGSDTNAPISFLAPGDAVSCPGDEARDWAQYGELGRLWRLLEERTPLRAERSLEHFLRAWARWEQQTQS